MDANDIEKLFTKYKEGYSSLEEEEILFNTTKEIKPSLKAWSVFVRTNKTKTPENLNDRLWESFERKKINKRRFTIGVLSVAASVIFFVSLLVYNFRTEKLTFSEEEVLLHQALQMFPNESQKEMKPTIIYENEMIIVYKTLE